MKDRGQFLGSAVLAVAILTGCAAPRPPEQTVSPMPTGPIYGPPAPDKTPEPSRLSNHQIILDAIERLRNPDEAEISNWLDGPEPNVTFPPDNNNPPSQEDLDNRGFFVDERFNDEFSAMKRSNVELIRDSGEFLDSSIPNSFNIFIDVTNTSTEPMGLNYVGDGEFFANVSAGFIMNQSGRALAVNFVRLTSGLSYVRSLDDPANLTDDQFMQFVSESYADEAKAYIELCSKTGYFSIESEHDPNFERVLSAYIQYGEDSEEYRSIVRQIMNAAEPTNSSFTS